LTRITRIPPRSTTSGRPRERRPGQPTVREARTRRSFDAVLTSYIRELATAQDDVTREQAR